MLTANDLLSPAFTFKGIPESTPLTLGYDGLPPIALKLDDIYILLILANPFNLFLSQGVFP